MSCEAEKNGFRSQIRQNNGPGGFVGYWLLAPLSAGPALRSSAKSAGQRRTRRASVPSSLKSRKRSQGGTRDTVDEQNPAPPKKPWNDESFVNANKREFPTVSEWCMISSIHSTFALKQSLGATWPTDGLSVCLNTVTGKVGRCSQEMAERGIKPNVVSHSAVLTACDKASDTQHGTPKCHGSGAFSSASPSSSSASFFSFPRTGWMQLANVSSTPV